MGSSQSGFIGGGQAGYNWQTGAFVLGVETDFDGTSMSKTFNYTSPPFAVGRSTGLLGDSLSVHAKANLDWLGTTRARVGFVATPDNRLMFYATGGVAYGGGSSSFSVYDATQMTSSCPAAPAPRESDGRSARGAEYAITNNITIKGEYLYFDLGSTSFTTPATSPPSPPLRRGLVRDRQEHLRWVDHPRRPELQVLKRSAHRSDARFEPEERRLSSGFFLRAARAALRTAADMARPNRNAPDALFHGR